MTMKARTGTGFGVPRGVSDLKLSRGFRHDPGLFPGDTPMNLGKTLFSQIMDFLPWKTFHRIVARRGGDKGVRTLTCAEQYRAML
jgi:hypothetical protein